MSDTVAIVIICVLLACLIVVCVGAVGVAGLFAWQTHRKLMFFHNAGVGIAQTELEKQRLKIQILQVEVDRTKAQTELKHAEARTDSTARALAGGPFQGQRSRVLSASDGPMSMANIPTGQSG